MTELEEMRRNYENACKTIAEMYEAGTGRKGLGPVVGVVEDLRTVRKGLEAAHKNYEFMLDKAKRSAEWGRKQYGDYMKFRLELKTKARKHRERAALNRENHRLLQNAHRKTLARMRNAEDIIRRQHDSRLEERTLISNVEQVMRRFNVEQSFALVRELLVTTGEMGLGQESRIALAALYSIGAQFSGTAASSAQAPAPRLPSPEYGCAGVPLGLEPWDDDP